MIEPAEVWGGADYERIAERFAPIHAELVDALAPAAGEVVLDVATGTGEVALRAARRGARVSALDFAPEMLRVAREKDETEAVDWTEGDAQALPYRDAAFDVVASCFGVIFAPDPHAAAAELGRVTRPGGRLGLTTWEPNAGLHSIYAAYTGDQAGADPAEAWGEPERVEALAGDAFELTIQKRTWNLEGDSPEDVWELMTSSAPPVKALVESLEPEQLDAFRTAMLEYWGGFQVDGRVVEPRGYLLVMGRRR